MFHKYEWSSRNAYGDRSYGSSYALKMWAVIPLFIILAVSLAFNVSQHSVVRAFVAQDQAHTGNYVKWNEYRDRVQAENDALRKDRLDLITKYENLQCSTRGLVVTTVKGIKLCMNPETKALHKIDGEAN